MRCSKSARRVSLIVALAAFCAAASPSEAQNRARSSEEDERSENMKMPNVSIEGERQTPDIFFVFPTGKGGNLSAPRTRNYSNDILEPVVKPWFERDQSVNQQRMASTGKTFDWDEALRSEPDRAPAPEAAPAAGPQMQMPQMPSLPSIPSVATQGALGAPSAPPPPPSSSQPSYAPPPAPSYPSAPAGNDLSYPSVPTANRPYYPPGTSPESFAPRPGTAPSSTYRAPSAPSTYSAPSAAPRTSSALPPPQIPSQALSLPQSRPQPGIPSWATQPPPGR